MKKTEFIYRIASFCKHTPKVLLVANLHFASNFGYPSIIHIPKAKPVHKEQ